VSEVDALVIGAGPAGLIAAETLAKAGRRVLIADGSPQPARKFLLAGRGGLNLTHSEPLEVFLTRYGAARVRLGPAIRAFDPAALRAWAAALGEPTTVGSSGRVFPKSFKATPLLRAWLAALGALGVELRTRWRWQGFDAAGAARFGTPDGEKTFTAGAYILALGGGSWPRLGGDGAWTSILNAWGVRVAPLEAANAGWLVNWSATFRDRFAGEPLKAARWRFGDLQTRAEAVITREGVEGGAVYALGAALRADLQREGQATVELDLKPDWTAEKLAERLARPSPASLSNILRKAAQLSPVAIGLMREAGEVPRESEALARLIKRCPLRISGLSGLARAISSAGGVAWEEIDEQFGLIKRQGVFVAGEMIDWEAPTGGYLLQACFATGAAAARGAENWLARPAR
jgi:uncharacterized flavoprotein (TIGR03862 family)